MNAKYKFQTIVATEAVRAAFTALRDKLGSTDKQLMSAMFTLAEENPEVIEQKVLNAKIAIELERTAKRELKAAAKLKEKEGKEPAKRGRKPKAKEETPAEEAPKASKRTKKEPRAPKQTKETATVVEPETFGQEDPDAIAPLVVTGEGV